jgi:hypothetical protein
LLQKGWHGLVKATEREGPDQNTQKPEEFPDDRELVEFFNDSNDKSIHAVITCILSITSIPGVSFLYIYVLIKIPMVSICYFSGKTIFLRTEDTFNVEMPHDVIQCLSGPLLLTLSQAPEPYPAPFQTCAA